MTTPPRPPKRAKSGQNITTFKWKIGGEEILFGYDNNNFRFEKLSYKRRWFRPVIHLQLNNRYPFFFWGATPEEYEKIKEELLQHLSELAILNNL